MKYWIHQYPTHMVHLYDLCRYVYDGPIHLSQEVDGLRVIGNYTHEFLHRIPGIWVICTFRYRNTGACRSTQ